MTAPFSCAAALACAAAAGAAFTLIAVAVVAFAGVTDAVAGCAACLPTPAGRAAEFFAVAAARAEAATPRPFPDAPARDASVFALAAVPAPVLATAAFAVVALLVVDLSMVALAAVFLAALLAAFFVAVLLVFPAVPLALTAAPLVLAAVVFAVVAVDFADEAFAFPGDFVTAEAARFAAVLVRAAVFVALAFTAAPLLLDPVFAGAFAATLAATLADALPPRDGSAERLTSFVRAALDAVAFEEAWLRADAVETPAPFLFSLFLADGIRGTLLLRPAVETGRKLQTFLCAESTRFQRFCSKI